MSEAADTALPNSDKRVEISSGDLPLHCPMPGKRLWDSHPKVYLPFTASNEQICPYCSTRYVLVDTVDVPH